LSWTMWWVLGIWLVTGVLGLPWGRPAAAGDGVHGGWSCMHTGTWRDSPQGWASEPAGCKTPPTHPHLTAHESTTWVMAVLCTHCTAPAPSVLANIAFGTVRRFRWDGVHPAVLWATRM
jgi:hypothetical protein